MDSDRDLIMSSIWSPTARTERQRLARSTVLPLRADHSHRVTARQFFRLLPAVLSSTTPTTAARVHSARRFWMLTLIRPVATSSLLISQAAEYIPSSRYR